MRRSLLCFLCMVVWLLQVNIGLGSILRWNENTEEDLDGYNVYYEAEYESDVVDVGLDNSLDLSFLMDGVRYVLNVTAYDRTGNESGFSDSLIYMASGWIPCLADINGDGRVDNIDETILNQEFGRTKCKIRGKKKCFADLDKDRDVDMDDAIILTDEYGRADC